MEKKVVLITGASSGIGYETAELLASQGHVVYGAARRVDRMEPLRASGVVPLSLDVTDQASAEAAVKAVVDAEGRIDVLINNAGYGSFGPLECVSLEEAQRQMDVNVFGMARMAKLVLPHMRRQHRGRIINLSSIAGRVTVYMGSWYNASKYAVEALSDALRMDVRRFGIDVVIIEPGCIASEWGGITADHLEEAGRGTAYEEATTAIADVYRKAYGPGSWFTSRTGLAARTIARAATVKRPRTRYMFGFGALPLRLLRAVLPTRALDWFMTHFFALGRFL